MPGRIQWLSFRMARDPFRAEQLEVRYCDFPSTWSLQRPIGIQTNGLPIDIFSRLLIHNNLMPQISMPKGALALLVLRVLQSGPLHGYAIAQRIRQLSSDVLEAEEGALYPALQRILLEGWVSARWGKSESGRRVRFYQLTPEGLRQLKRERTQYELATTAIQAILQRA